MSDRNLNPHAEARVAMALWSDRYSKQKLGCMDFYDGLTAAQKQTCAQIVDGIIYADRADGRTPPPTDISLGWRPVSCLKLRMMATKLRKDDLSDETAALMEEAAADIERLALAPAEHVVPAALMKDGFMTCVAEPGRPYVKINFPTLKQAQNLHSALATASRQPQETAPAEDVEGKEPPLDWSNFEGAKRNIDWKPDDQDLIYTAINYRDDEYGDADEDVGQQLVERLLAAWKTFAVSEQITFENAARLLKERDAAEKARAEQWRLRRDAEGSRDAAYAAADSLRVIRDAAAAYVTSVNGEPEKDCWDTEDGKEAPGAERFASDWSWKAYDDAKQKAFDALRAAISASEVEG